MQTTMNVNAARVVWLLAGIAPVWGCGGAAAPEAPPAPEIRRITQTEATSDCIGDPKTPLCAVETFIACWVRRERPLCDTVGIRKTFSFGDSKYVVAQVDYHLTKEFTIRAEDIPPHLKDVEWYQPGMVELEFRLRDCFEHMRSCEEAEWTGYSYTVEKIGDSWRVVSWAAWGDEDFGDYEELERWDAVKP
jgi:hypothetical protein